MWNLIIQIWDSWRLMLWLCRWIEQYHVSTALEVRRPSLEWCMTVKGIYFLFIKIFFFVLFVCAFIIFLLDFNHILKPIISFLLPITLECCCRSGHTKTDRQYWEREPLIFSIKNLQRSCAVLFLIEQVCRLLVTSCTWAFKPLFWKVGEWNGEQGHVCKTE